MNKKYIWIGNTDCIEQHLDDMIYDSKSIPVGEFSNLEVLKRLDWLVDASTQTSEQFEKARQILIEFEGDCYRWYGGPLDSELEDEFDNYMDMIKEVVRYEEELNVLTYNFQPPLKPLEFVNKFFEYLPTHVDEFEPETFLKPLVEALGFTYSKRGLATEDGYVDYIYVNSNITDEFEDYMRGFNYIDVKVFNERGEFEEVYTSIWLPYGEDIEEVMWSIGYERDEYYVILNEFVKDYIYSDNLEDYYNWCEYITRYEFFDKHNNIKRV